MNDSVITLFMLKTEQALSELAEGSMTHPSSDPFEHGMRCGRYQGMKEALRILDNIISGDEEADNLR